MMRRTLATALLAFALLPNTGALAQRVQDPPPSTSTSPGPEAVERGLLPAVVAAGQPAPSWTLAERMRRYAVPGVSIAVIDDGRIAWARGYGVRRVGTPDSITDLTLFQAASISKPVAAVGALRLVRQGRLALDEDVNEKLRSWRVPRDAKAGEGPVTLRGLLSHSAGVTVHGFPGYERGMPVPSLREILEGGGAANSPPIRVDIPPGSRSRYSGGGYVILQQLVEDVTGRPFTAAMRELVLEPAGMTSSTYDQPLPSAHAAHAASAHDWHGKLVAGDWHTYPELAAAGLWTTPTDLARFALAVRSAWAGQSDSLLDQATARTMLTEVLGGTGLGVGVAGEGRGLRFVHGGSNKGFRSYLVMYPERGDGVVVMTNGDEGAALMMEVVRAVARVYEWPDYAPSAREIANVPPARLDELAGTYYTRGSQRPFVVTREGGALLVETPRGSRFTFLPTSERRFVAVEDGSTMSFERDDGRLELRAFGLRARRERAGSERRNRHGHVPQ